LPTGCWLALHAASGVVVGRSTRSLDGMRITHARTVPLVLGLIYAYGAVLGIVGLGLSWLSSREIPHLEWWQFALAPLAIGAVAAVVEGVGTFLLGGFTFGDAESRTRRAAGKFVFVVTLVALAVAWPLYQMSKQ
jgi:hypothetical protein